VFEVTEVKVLNNVDIHSVSLVDSEEFGYMSTCYYIEDRCPKCGMSEKIVEIDFKKHRNCFGPSSAGQKTIIFNHLGFPLKLINCPHIIIDGESIPDVNYEQLENFCGDKQWCTGKRV
jgi:hypothetical protein